MICWWHFELHANLHKALIRTECSHWLWVPSCSRAIGANMHTHPHSAQPPDGQLTAARAVRAADQDWSPRFLSIAFLPADVLFCDIFIFLKHSLFEYRSFNWLVWFCLQLLFAFVTGWSSYVMNLSFLRSMFDNSYSWFFLNLQSNVHKIFSAHDLHANCSYVTLSQIDHV